MKTGTEAAQQAEVLGGDSRFAIGPVPVAAWSDHVVSRTQVVYQRVRARYMLVYWLILAAAFCFVILSPLQPGLAPFIFLPALSSLALKRDPTARPEELMLFDNPEDPLSRLVSIRLMRKEEILGMDRGLATVDDLSLDFTGQRTAFCIGAADFVPSSRVPVGADLYGKRSLELHLSHPEGDLVLVISPVPLTSNAKDHFMGRGNQLHAFHKPFVEAVLRLPSADRPADLARVFPPVVALPVVGRPVDWKVVSLQAVGCLLAATVTFLVTHRPGPTLFMILLSPFFFRELRPLLSDAFTRSEETT